MHPRRSGAYKDEEPPAAGGPEGEAADKEKKAAEDENQDEEDRSPRARLERFLETSKQGHALEFFNCFMSIAACLLYVLGTYISFEWVQLTELSMTMFFAVDYVVRLGAARNRFQHALSVHSMVDFVTVVPSFIVYGQDDHHLHVQIISFLRVLRILRITRITRLLPQYVESEVRQKMFGIGLTVVSLVFVAAGLIHLVENMEHLWPKGTTPYPDGLPFHDVMYLIVMTITTVGYGDISPKTEPGRGVILVMMVTALVLVPRQTNELIAIMALSSTYARDRYRINSPHVLVCGALNTAGVTALFAELFHVDHGQVDLYAVALARSLPSAEMYAAITHPAYGFFVKYLDGSVMNDRDLRRAAAEVARAVFVVSNQLSSNPEQDDAGTILRAMAVRRFVLKESDASRLVTCVQLIRPESKKIFKSATQRSGAANHRTTDHIVCTHELKMKLIAKSCTCPGVTTMLYNLVASCSDEETAANHSLDWINEYNQGRGFEVYRVPLSENFGGLTFLGAAEIVYKEAGCLLFALEVQPAGRAPRVVLNPGRFVLPQAQEQRCGLFGFVIAEDRAEAHVVSSISEADVDANVDPLLNLKRRQPRRSSLVQQLQRVARRSSTHDPAAARVTMMQSTLAQQLQAARMSAGPNDAPASGPPATPKGTASIQAAGPNMARTRRGTQLFGSDAARTSITLGATGALVGHRLSRVNSQQGGGTFHRLSNASSASDSSVDSRKRSTFKSSGDLSWLADAPPALPGHAVQQLKQSKRRLSALAGAREPQGHQHRSSSRLELFYHMRASPVAVRDVTFESVHDIRPGFGNHIILMGLMSDLYHFVLPLRAKTHNVVHPIVILALTPPAPLVWKKIARFQDVSFVQGNPLDPLDLDRAGVFDAAAAVIFAKSGEGVDVGDGMLSDADAIFASKILQTLVPGLFVMNEFISNASLNFLVGIDADEDEVDNVFASGSVFMASMLDTLVCQAFYNPHIITIVRAMVAADPRAEKHWNSHCNPDDKDDVGKMYDSHLWQVSVPDEFHCKSYGELFTFLVREMCMLPIGVRRGGGDADNAEGRMGNRLPYVYTNPGQDDPVFSDDTVFVLSQKPPADDFAGQPGPISVNDIMFQMWGEMNEDLETMYTAVAALARRIQVPASHRSSFRS